MCANALWLWLPLSGWRMVSGSCTHRCLVPFTSFSGPEAQPDGTKLPAWLTLDETRPWAFFAGIFVRNGSQYARSRKATPRMIYLPSLLVKPLRTRCAAIRFAVSQAYYFSVCSWACPQPHDSTYAHLSDDPLPATSNAVENQIAASLFGAQAQPSFPLSEKPKTIGCKAHGTRKTDITGSCGYVFFLGRAAFLRFGWPVFLAFRKPAPARKWVVHGRLWVSSEVQ